MTTQSIREEIANSITHGIGALLSIVGVSVLVSLSVLKLDTFQILGISLYGLSLFLVYVSSTAYHAFQDPLVKRAFRIVDHISIYFLIAGSYTPFVLIYMNNPTGWTMLAIQWGLVLAGIFFKIFLTGKYDWLSTGIYLAMGWMVVMFAKPVLESLPNICLWWGAAGGLSYTLGVLFYSWTRLPYHHAIWHLFVMGGSIFHYIAIVFAVLHG